MIYLQKCNYVFMHKSVFFLFKIFAVFLGSLIYALKYLDGLTFLLKIKKYEIKISRVVLLKYIFILIKI